MRNPPLSVYKTVEDVVNEDAPDDWPLSFPDAALVFEGEGKKKLPGAFEGDAEITDPGDGISSTGSKPAGKEGIELVMSVG